MKYPKNWNRGDRKCLVVERYSKRLVAGLNGSVYLSLVSSVNPILVRSSSFTFYLVYNEVHLKCLWLCAYDTLPCRRENSFRLIFLLCSTLRSILFKCYTHSQPFLLYARHIRKDKNLNLNPEKRNKTFKLGFLLRKWIVFYFCTVFWININSVFLYGNMCSI